MVKMIHANSRSKRKKYAVIVSRFNEFITENLLKGCLKELKYRGTKDSDITVVWVPGSFEIPVTALRLAKKKSIHAVICLGAIIRGETLHYELVARNTAEGIAHVALQTGKPCIFGVLVTETVDQAYKRSELNGDNKGQEAAGVAVNMANLFDKI